MTSTRTTLTIQDDLAAQIEALRTDAHIAALAVEHGYTVYSNDTDFARFQNVKWVNPLI